MSADDDEKTKASNESAGERTAASFEHRTSIASEPKGAPDTATRAIDAEHKEGGITVNSVLDGRFEIISVLGKGGMGTVFLGKHLSLDRMVAIKAMHKSALAEGQELQRFLNEGKALALLRHPSITECYFIGVADGQPYMVMEHLRGKSLWKLMREENPLDISRVIDITVQIADALAYAHEKGIVHRDLKPSNIMLVEDELAPKPSNELGDETGKILAYNDNVKVLDFGIAKFVQDDAGYAQKITQSGQLVGTFNYMSPEQCNAKSVDQRSDIFSLGVVLYELLAGKLPFKGDSPLDTLNKITSDDVPMIERQLPPGLYGVLLKSLNKNPDKRYQGMNEFKSDLLLVKNGNTDVLGRLLAVEKAAKRKLAKHFPYFALAALLLLALCAAGYLVFKTKESARKQNIAKAPPISRRSFDPEAHNKVEKYRKAYSISNDKKQFDALTATIDILEKYDHKQLPKEDLNTLKMYLYYRGNGYDIMCQPPNKIEASKVVAMSNNYVKAAELIEESKLRSKVDKDILDVEYIKIKAATEAFPGDHASTYKLLNDFSVITRVCKGKDSAEFALVKQQLSEFLKQHPECKDLD